VKGAVNGVSLMGHVSRQEVINNVGQISVANESVSATKNTYEI
jgi:hypothetical protein